MPRSIKAVWINKEPKSVIHPMRRQPEHVYERLLLHPIMQLCLACLCSLLLPLGLFQSQVHYQHGLWSGMALGLSLLIWSRLRSFPYSRGLSTSLPLFTLIWSISALISSAMNYLPHWAFWLSSWCGVSVWLLLMQWIERRIARPYLALVPFGRIAQLKLDPTARTLVLKTPQLPDDQVIDALVADLQSDDLPAQWEEFLAECALQQLPVFHLSAISEGLTGKVATDHLRQGELGNLLPSLAYMRIKRMIDTCAALVLLPLLSPVLLLTAFLIKIDSPGQVIYKQKRIGYRGQPFEVYKFRSMRHEAEGEAFTAAEGDPRITRIGRIIRKYRIDELPQLLNVLKGDMSFIGPRPESEDLAAWYTQDVPFFAYRHIVRPGISGWAQVNQGYATQIEGMKEKLQYDFYYIKHFSLWLDVLIVFKTLRTIATGFGAR